MLRSSLTKRFLPSGFLYPLSADSAALRKPGPNLAPRPYQGLDMNKLHTARWVNVWAAPGPMRGGYQWGRWNAPSAEHMTKEELASYFDVRNYREKYTWWQLARLAGPEFRWLAHFVACLLVPVVPIIGVAWMAMRYEPLESWIPREEYYKHYRWHAYGHRLDHHAWAAYSEARRANKWRNAGYDLEKFIPEKYRGNGGMANVVSPGG